MIYLVLTFILCALDVLSVSKGFFLYTKDSLALVINTHNILKLYFVFVLPFYYYFFNFY